jgi:hypothetical protein
MAGLGYLGMLMGTWWWQMGVSLFMYSDYANAVPDAAAPHTGVILLGQNILYVTVIAIFVTELAKRIDRARYPQTFQKEEVEV